MSISLEPPYHVHKNFCADHLWPWLGPPLWRRCNTLHTSSFTDVTFGRNGPYGDAWTAHPQPTTASGVAIQGRSLMSMNDLFAIVFKNKIK